MTEGTGNVSLDNRFDVMVCTGELVFTGILKCGFEQRLIDALNEGVRLNPKAKIVDFIVLQDAVMTGPGDLKKKFPRIYITKHNIIFVAQVISKKQGKSIIGYPFKPKTSTEVTIFASQLFVTQTNAQPYELKGEIYIDTWGQIVDTLETELQFIPLTNVKIEQSPPYIGRGFDFVAINKQRIISICENPAR